MLKSNREIEYTHVHARIEHLYDTRLHVFNFVLILNAALLAAVQQLTSDPVQKCVISFFGILATSFMLLIERRTIFVADQYVEYLKELEIELSLSLQTTIDQKLKKSKFRTRSYFSVLYFILILMWLIQISYFIWG
jgi:uncharacterized membrane protein YjjP (DUF1212 family)